MAKGIGSANRLGEDRFIGNGRKKTEERLIGTYRPSYWRNRPVGIFIFSSLAFISLFFWLPMFAFTGKPNGPPPNAHYIPLAFLALSVFALLKWYLDDLGTELSITTRRSTLKTGLLNVKTTEIRHKDIRNIQLRQSFGQRLFKVGDIAVDCSGQDGIEIVIGGITRPETVAQVLRQYQDGNE